MKRMISFYVTKTKGTTVIEIYKPNNTNRNESKS
ncbi:hypothetical protein SAMN05444372_102241 [Flavobacterium micromati]|uniref:Uncharacterized protein n=1 Tax=Flavobacterium micromati TaxID=229205 RepID=A0A1M5H0Y9_9FLAO|nr:hypothetical protein SAMN05444372_102241 [Flavobacterium micromati]